jgi:branched-chain amino acid transport system permease protein
MALLGGSGTIYGGLIGAAILLGLSEFLSDMSSHWMFYLGLLIVLRVLLVGEPFKGGYKLLSNQLRPARD